MNTDKCNKDKIGNFDIPDNVVLSSIIQYPPGFLFVPGENSCSLCRRSHQTRDTVIRKKYITIDMQIKGTE